MALVQLCHMVNWVGEYRCSPILHAFVVDHKIREGSGAEALLTARRIEQLSLWSPKISIRRLLTDLYRDQNHHLTPAMARRNGPAQTPKSRDGSPQTPLSAPR